MSERGATKRYPDYLRVVHSPDESAGKLPPHDLDAEAAVLSACLLSRQALLRIVDILKPWDFYSDANGRIYAAACELAAREQPTDLVTVCAMLRDRGQLPSVGGMTYVAQLADATPAVANIEAHAVIVAELSQRRQLIGTCQKIASAGYGEIESHADFIASAEASIAELTTKRSGDHMSTLREAISWAFGSIRQAENGAGGAMLGLSTGLRSLDALTAGVHGGAMTLIGAKRGGGKTALANGIEINVAATPDADGIFRNGVLRLSLEMPRAQIATRMACSVGRVNWHRVRSGHATRDDYARLYGAAEWMAGLPLLIDDEPNISIAKLQKKISRAIAKFEAEDKRLALISIDYMQLMSADGCERGANRERQVSFIGEKVKHIANALKTVPLLALTQLNAEGQARESSALEMHADDMWTVETDPAELPRFDGDRVPARTGRVKVSKQRMGPEGVAPLFWHPWCTSFSDEPELR
jgi:replicative DNA helicase